MLRTQAHRAIAVATPLGDDELLLKSVTVTEGLGRLFELELELLSEDPEVQFDDIVGENVTVRVETTHGDTRYFNGIVSAFTQTPGAGRLASYRATVVPWLWLLSRTADCRIFQEKTVPEIIKEVFRGHGLADFEDRLSGTYRQWEYCVQYRETDFNFVSRLMEQEGIYYFFEHDNGRHTLVLADGPSAHEPFAGYERISYRPLSHASTDREHIRSWTVSQQVQPGGYALNDFDFKDPKKVLHTVSRIRRPHAASEFEIYEYPGEYAAYADGESYARMRIEELQAQHETVRGTSDVRGLATGHTFELTDHPRDDQCRGYLVTSASVTFRSDEFDSRADLSSGEEVCECSFTAIDSTTPFRPPRITPKPQIRGPQTAIVAGREGEEIYTDQYGRVKVQFHWDRYSQADETSSCWIRVSQPWAGKKWGSMFIPRVGQEVIVEFLEGDPDRPIITGRVYNGCQMPPYKLPASKTLSTLKSNSSKGGQGFNELRFQDEKGEEQIFIHAEKNHDVRVKNDCFETIGRNRHLIVKQDQLEHVENNRHEIVDADHMEKIGKDRHLRITGKEAKKVGGSHSFAVTGDVIEVFKSSHSEQVAESYFLRADDIVVEATKAITLKVGGSFVVIDPGGVSVQGPMVKLNSGGSPGDGTPGNLVPPAPPTKAEEADDADPGEVAEVKARQRETKTGKYGSTPVKPFKPLQAGEAGLAPRDAEAVGATTPFGAGEGKEQNRSWIEIELVDEVGNPVPGERYKITLPDGDTVAEGTLDENGLARVDGIDPGECTVTFPNLDHEAWEPE